MQVRLPKQLVAAGVAALVLGAIGAPATAKRPSPSASKHAAEATLRPIDLKQDVPGEAFAPTWARFSKRGAGQEELFVRFSAMTGAPRVIYGDLGEAPEAAMAGDRAMLFLQMNAEMLGVDTRDLVAARSWEFPESGHFYYEQKYRGLPVFYGEVAVHIGANGHVRGLTNTYVPITPKSTEPAIRAGEAFRAAVAAVVDDERALIPEFYQEPRLGIWPTSDGGRLAWRTVVSSRRPVGEFEVFVDAVTGDVLGEPFNTMCLAVDGTGKPYNISPVVSEANDAYRDNQTIPEAAYYSQTLRDLVDSGPDNGKLNGPYSMIHPSMNGFIVRTNHDYSDLRRGLSTSTNSNFDEENVYWHIDKAQRTFQELGFTVANGNAIMNYPIKVYAHSSPSWGNQDNSSFTGSNLDGTGTGYLQFGTGGVDDAEDGEIVWHEYGHAILWNQRPGINQNVSSEGIGEGFGDYLAGAMAQIVDNDGNGTRTSYYVTVGEWDATSYNASGTPHPNLRTLNQPGMWSSRPSAVHTAGTYWSHPVHDYTTQVNVRVGLRTVLRHNFLLDLSPRQDESAAAMIEADTLLWNGATAGQIRSAFGERGTPIGTGGTVPTVTNVIHTPGVVMPGSNIFALRDSFTDGPAIYQFPYGDASWTKFAGDWDGNSADGPGAYNPANGVFYLRNSNSAGNADLQFQYGPSGNAGWRPIVGDWDGDGDETIGLYNPANGVFYLRNTNTAGNADLQFQFGPAGSNWTPLAGDWNGDGTDSIGLYDPATGIFYLRDTNNAGPATNQFVYGPGGQGWLPFTGNWDADASTSAGHGKDSIGVYEPSTGIFYLRQVLLDGPADIQVIYGPANATPVIGDWRGRIHP